jgi:hypothetical protein
MEAKWDSLTGRRPDVPLAMRMVTMPGRATLVTRELSRESSTALNWATTMDSKMAERTVHLMAPLSAVTAVVASVQWSVGPTVDMSVAALVGW